MTIITGLKATAIVAGKKTAKIAKPFKSVGEGISKSASRLSLEIKTENAHQKILRHNRQVTKANNAILTTAEEES